MHPMVGQASCFVRSWNKKWKEYLSQKDVGATTPTAKSNTHTHTGTLTQAGAEVWTQSFKRKIKIKDNIFNF